MVSTLAESELLLVLGASVPVIYIAVVAFGRWLKRRQGVRLGVAYQLFAIAFAIWLPLHLSRYFFKPAPYWAEEWHRHQGALTALLGALVFLALVRRYFWEQWFEKNQHTRAPKFLSQIVGLLIVIAVMLVVARFAYPNAMSGLALGSTVVAAIVGFALQDLLGNIFAGLALELGKPFRTGDWLIVDKMRVEVIEVNWRSTRLRTTDDVYFDIPNKHIVGTTITNLTYPTRQHAIRFTVGFDYGAPPNYVKDCMRRAASSVKGVLTTPPPKVYLKEFADSAVLYEIRIWIDDETQHSDILDSVRTNIWYEAQRSGIRIPFPIRTVQIERQTAGRERATEAARACLRKQPFLQVLDERQADQLLQHARVLRFGRGEKVIEQGADGHSMFILLEGEADVLVRANGGEDTRVATLHTGDCCGEMSLLTGEPRSASVVARSDCEVWEISKDVFAEVLQENQQIVQKLSELLARRRMENEGALATVGGNGRMENKQKEYTESFLKKLYSFFEL